MFELQPDFEKILERYGAWWECEILDRPLVSITFSKPENEKIPYPKKEHPSIKERWLDTEYVVEKEETNLNNKVHFADALPVAMPNLGPEIFSAFYGCELEFDDRTSWSEPILNNLSGRVGQQYKLDKNSFYYRKMMEMTQAFIDRGKDKFIVGLPTSMEGVMPLQHSETPRNFFLTHLSIRKR
jgi:hypothetical protein